ICLVISQFDRVQSINSSVRKNSKALNSHKQMIPRNFNSYSSNQHRTFGNGLEHPTISFRGNDHYSMGHSGKYFPQYQNQGYQSRGNNNHHYRRQDESNGYRQLPQNFYNQNQNSGSRPSSGRSNYSNGSGRSSFVRQGQLVSINYEQTKLSLFPSTCEISYSTICNVPSEIWNQIDEKSRNLSSKTSMSNVSDRPLKLFVGVCETCSSIHIRLIQTLLTVCKEVNADYFYPLVTSELYVRDSYSVDRFLLEHLSMNGRNVWQHLQFFDHHGPTDDTVESHNARTVAQRNDSKKWVTLRLDEHKNFTDGKRLNYFCGLGRLHKQLDAICHHDLPLRGCTQTLFYYGARNMVIIPMCSAVYGFSLIDGDCLYKTNISNLTDRELKLANQNSRSERRYSKTSSDFDKLAMEARNICGICHVTPPLTTTYEIFDDDPRLFMTCNRRLCVYLFNAHRGEFIDEFNVELPPNLNSDVTLYGIQSFPCTLKKEDEKTFNRSYKTTIYYIIHFAHKGWCHYKVDFERRCFVPMQKANRRRAQSNVFVTQLDCFEGCRYPFILGFNPAYSYLMVTNEEEQPYTKPLWTNCGLGSINTKLHCQSLLHCANFPTVTFLFFVGNAFSNSLVISKYALFHRRPQSIYGTIINNKNAYGIDSLIEYYKDVKTRVGISEPMDYNYPNSPLINSSGKSLGWETKADAVDTYVDSTLEESQLEMKNSSTQCEQNEQIKSPEKEKDETLTDSRFFNRERDNGDDDNERRIRRDSYSSPKKDHSPWRRGNKSPNSRSTRKKRNQNSIPITDHHLTFDKEDDFQCDIIGVPIELEFDELDIKDEPEEEKKPEGNLGKQLMKRKLEDLMR
ncbi:hypothetical protein SNEBB_003887, partial [Seison nebaliae]